MSCGPQSSLIQPGEDGLRPTNQHMRSGTDIKPASLVLGRGGHLARLTPSRTCARNGKGEGDKPSHEKIGKMLTNGHWACLSLTTSKFNNHKILVSRLKFTSRAHWPLARLTFTSKI